MTNRELEELFRNIESDRVERKASLSDTSKVCQAICAFANDLPNYRQPGVIFVGVNDNGICANLAITDELLLRLSAMRSDGNILPFPVLSVRKIIVDGCEIAAVIVEPSDSPPLRFNGRVWIRVGPRRASTTTEEERRLNEKRRAGDLPFDLRPMPSASLDDLNLTFFEREYLPAALAPEVLEENQRPIHQQLVSLRLATPELIPTVLGILAIGQDPRQYVPGAYVQFLRIDGTELGDPASAKEISGSLLDILRMLDEVLTANLSTEVDITSGAVESRSPDYPIAALQQLVRNAILHRSYESTNAPVRIYWFRDRIEIHNPGSLFGQVDRQNFGTGVTDYRNPHLAEAIKNLGYVQRFGFGIALARRALAQNGNPPPEFAIEDTYFAVTVRRRA
jgi:ATP-dependent DNA helicase RecG